MKIFASLLVCGSAALGAQTPPTLMLPTGHSGPVTAVAFSPAGPGDPAGGKYILTGSRDKTAKLWDRSGHEILTYSGHAYDVTSVAFSPDGRFVLTGSNDTKAKIWELAGGEPKTLSEHTDFVTAVAFSPAGPTDPAGGKYVLTGSRDKTAKLWDAASGKAIRTFQHNQAVTAVAFSPDGKSFLTGSADGTLRRWNTASAAAPIKSFPAHKGFAVTSVAFSRDGKFILTGSTDRTAKLWSIDNPVPKKTFAHGAEVYSAAFSPDGKLVLTAGLDGKAKRWDTAPGNLKPDRTFSHGQPLSAAAFSPDGKSILTGSEDMTAPLWDTSGRPGPVLKGYTNGVTALAFSTDAFTGALLLLTGSADGTVKRWNQSGKDVQNFPGYKQNNQERRPVAVSPDGESLLTAGEGNAVKRRDLSGKVLQTYPVAGAVTAVAFSPDGKSVLAGSDQNAVYIWDLAGKPLHTFSISKQINALAFSPDGKSVATGSRNGAVSCWDLTGAPLQNLEQAGPEILSVSFSPATKTDPGGKFLVSGDANGAAKLWDMASGKPKTFSMRSGGISAVTFSSGGGWLLTGNTNGTIKAWDTADAQKERATVLVLDTADWVVTCPSGLFDASPGAMNRMYYVQDLDVTELEQLENLYWEPGLLAQIQQEKRLRDVSALGALPQFPELDRFVRGDSLHVRMTLRKGRPDSLNLLINGKELAENINPDNKPALDVDLAPFGKFFLDTNAIVLRAYIGGLEKDYELSYILPGGGAKGSGNTTGGASTPHDRGLPHLYGIVVGTAQYARPKMKLKFPDLDASAMYKALGVAGERLFPGRVHLELLSTAEGQKLANRANIKTAFDSIATRAKATDILVVYFSGHGMTFDSQFYYLTLDVPDFDLTNPAVRTNLTVSGADLTAWCKAIPAQKQVLIFDACNAGSFANNAGGAGAKGAEDPTQVRAYDEMKDRTGTFILAGAAADKSSYEDPVFGQGLLTYSLLEGMHGLALLDDQRVDVMQLFQYARKTVPQMAKYIDPEKEQTPMMAFPKGQGGSGETFSIGQVDELTKQKMPPLNPPAKTIYIKPKFLNTNGGGDPLKLERELADYLRAREDKGKLVYRHVDEYENGYQISGSYQLSGDKVEFINVFLNKGGVQVGKFGLPEAGEAPYRATDVKRLVEKIVEKVQELVE